MFESREVFPKKVVNTGGERRRVMVRKFQRRKNGGQLWLFYSLLLVRNLKHSPICFCFSWHIPRPLPSSRSWWFLFSWPLRRLSGVWNPCLHTPMTANAKTAWTFDNIVTHGDIYTDQKTNGPLAHWQIHYFILLFGFLQSFKRKNDSIDLF